MSPVVQILPIKLHIFCYTLDDVRSMSLFPVQHITSGTFIFIIPLPKICYLIFNDEYYKNKQTNKHKNLPCIAHVDVADLRVMVQVCLSCLLTMV